MEGNPRDLTRRRRDEAAAGVGTGFGSFSFLLRAGSTRNREDAKWRLKINSGC
jgi:hypothetical protein